MIYMGLLDRIDEEEAVAETPVAEPVKKAKESKPRRSRRSKAAKVEPTVTSDEEPRSRRRSREPRKPREKVDRSLSSDYERAGTAAYSFRRLIDFIANVGWSFPIIFIMGSGSNFSPTYFLLGGLLITILNTVVLPIQFGRTLGNFTTRTSFVRHTGKNPVFAFHLLKQSVWRAKPRLQKAKKSELKIFSFYFGPVELLNQCLINTKSKEGPAGQFDCCVCVGWVGGGGSQGCIGH